MESILKIIGTEIYIGSFLFSSGLEGPAYAAKLREAEELERAAREALRNEYDANETISQLEHAVSRLQVDYDLVVDENEELQVTIDKLRFDLEVATSAPEPPTQSAT